MKTTAINDWLYALGSRTPTPGGGAVSALNGAIAAAQLKMVCEYTKDEEIKNKTGFLSEKVDMFLQLADDDSTAFSKVNEAYKSKDTQKIDSALIEALRVSGDVLDVSRELLSFCEENYRNFNQRLAADVITALANLRAAIVSAQAMEKTNIDSIKGDKPEALQDSDEILKRIDRLAETIKAGE